ncbi:MAG: MFS transporter [Ignavibacteriae bacterium]|nr:MFS transporter [Ignavibacteriota bacterium]
MTPNPEQHDKRNFFYNIIEGALWVTGALLISPQTVMPALITRLGGGNLEVGVLGAVLFLPLFLPQIFSARYAQTVEWKKPVVVGFGIAQRGAVFITTLVVVFLSVSHPTLVLWLFLSLFAINQLILGIVTPWWFDFYTKLTPLQRRGRLTGFRNALAGGLSIVGGMYLTWLLTKFDFPLNYSLAFATTFILQMVAIAFQSQIVEAYPSTVLPRTSVLEYFSQLKSILKENKPFQQFLWTSAFLILATIPMSFFTVYALKHFQASDSMVGTFTMITVGGQIIGALVNGYLADHFGNKAALISASLSFLSATLLALFAPSIEWFSVVFLFLGVFIGSEVMIRYNLAIEYGPVEQRATYIGLMNTILAPLYLTGLLGGVFSDLFGYKTVFAIGLTFSLVGITMLIVKVKEPRKV